jgi:hypothetical protein
VRDTQLFTPHFHASKFGTSTLFSVQHSVGSLSMGQGCRLLQSLILIDALSSACWEEKKRKRETAVVLFAQGWTHLAGCASWDFHGCYV